MELHKCKVRPHCSRLVGNSSPVSQMVRCDAGVVMASLFWGTEGLPAVTGGRVARDGGGGVTWLASVGLTARWASWAVDGIWPG